MIEIHLYGKNPIKVKSLADIADAAVAIKEAINSAHRSVSCDRKVRYGHHATAVKALEAMKAKGNDGLEAYACEFCEGWHLGHSR